MEFEKWQALGNDYVIVEQQALAFALTPGRIKAICAAHTGVGADGILLLAPAPSPRAVAHLRIFNPDGSEAELSGNGTRQAALYLRNRGWTQADHYTIDTAAGPIDVRIASATACTLHLGRARLASEDYPSGGPDGRGELRAGGRIWPFQHVQVGNPQCAIAVPSAENLQALDPAAIGPAIERDKIFPRRTNVSWFTELAPGCIRARIFERGVGETSASGTGATGAAVAYVLAGGRSPVTVMLDGGELEVAVGEDLDITLTGWAKPVFTGALAHQFIEELHETE